MNQDGAGQRDTYWVILDKGAEYSNFSPGYLETHFARLKMFDDIAKLRISFDKLDNPIPPELEQINATELQAVINALWFE